MKKLALILIVLFSQIAFSTVHGGTIRSDVEDSEYVEYGKKHKCVKRIAGFNITPSGPSTFTGSCVVIHPRIVITAAHVIMGADGLIVLDQDNEGETTYNRILFSVFPESFHKGNGNILRMERWDIAICLLEKDIDLDFYPELYDGRDEVEKICSIAGYGMTGVWDHGGISRGNKVDGIKRAGSNVIDNIENEMLVCSVGKGKNTSLEIMIASGDSGGGLFIDKKLAGINSSVKTCHDDKNPSNSDCNDMSSHTRVSTHVKWIKEAVVRLLELKGTNK